MTLRPNATLASTIRRPTSTIGSAATTNVTAYGGTLKYLPGIDAAPAAYAESIGTLALAGGTLKIETAQAVTDNTSTLTINTIDRTGRGTVLFTGVGLGSTATTATRSPSAAASPRSTVLSRGPCIPRAARRPLTISSNTSAAGL